MSNPCTPDVLSRHGTSFKYSLANKGPSNSCPVPIPASNKSMFVKSASATQLSLLIPPPTGMSRLD